MLTCIFQELIAQISALDIPVYLADCVPDGTPFPYLTAQVQPSLESQTNGTLILTAWSCNDSANAERLTHAENLFTLLPARGIRIPTDYGVLLLRLKSPAICVQDANVRGLQTVWRLSYIPSV